MPHRDRAPKVVRRSIQLVWSTERSPLSQGLRSLCPLYPILPVDEQSHCVVLLSSMSTAVKSPQAFFLTARTTHAACLVPFLRRLPALRLPPQAARGAVWLCRKRSWSAGVRLGSGARPERPSIRVEPATAPAPHTVIPCTPRASGTPSVRAHPSNERCLDRITQR